MAYVRRCLNWLETYKEWIYDRSQMSELLIEWSGVFTLAAVLRRRIALTRESAYLGSWDCYPFIYVIVVGPAGIGKTTSVRYSFDLLDQVPTLGKPPTFTTVEGIVDDLIKNDDNSTYIVAEELGDLMQKDHGGSKMFTFLTSLYDGKASIRQKTMSRGTEFADKPCGNLFAGTTMEWVADNIPANTLNGGFGSRVIWLYVPSLRRRKMYYRKEMKAKDYNAIEKKLVADLIHIGTALEGAYTIADDALEYMEDWNAKIPDRIKFKKISGYIMRKSVFVHKVAMIMHAAYSDTKILSLDDFQQAITHIEKLEPTLPKIFEGVGKNEYSIEMRDILEFIKENEGINEQDLREEFKTSAAPAKLSELIDGLLLAGLAKTEMDEETNKRKFYPL